MGEGRGEAKPNLGAIKLMKSTCGCPMYDPVVPIGTSKLSKIRQGQTLDRILLRNSLRCWYDFGY